MRRSFQSMSIGCNGSMAIRTARRERNFASGYGSRGSVRIRSSIETTQVDFMRDAKRAGARCRELLQPWDDGLAEGRFAT